MAQGPHAHALTRRSGYRGTGRTSHPRSCQHLGGGPGGGGRAALVTEVETTKNMTYYAVLELHIQGLGYRARLQV